MWKANNAWAIVATVQMGERNTLHFIQFEWDMNFDSLCVRVSV